MDALDISMPYSMDAEQAILGAILCDPSCLTLIQSKGFNAEYFYRNEHKTIYNAILKIDANGQTIDPLLVLEELKTDSTFDEASAKKYLVELANAVVSTTNVENYAKIVKDKFFIRSLIGISKDILDEATSGETDANLLLESAEAKIYNVRQGRGSDDASLLSQIVKDKLYDRLEKLNSSDPEVKAQYQGFTTGWQDLDNVIAGMNRSDLIIIGARPAMGKTSFALNLARNAAFLAGKKVLFFSLEMTKEQLAQRVMSTEARIKGNKMRKGNLDDSDWQRLAIATEALKDTQLYFDDTSGITANEMKAKIRRMKDVDMVVIDYLQLMKSATRIDSRVQEVSEITRSLKLMAKDLNIPVVVLAQLSRGTEGHGQKSHRPQLADLRESGSIEQDADIVIMLYREDYYANDPDVPVDMDKQIDTVDLIVAKNRHGPTETVTLGWNAEFTLFSAIEKKFDDQF